MRQWLVVLGGVLILAVAQLIGLAECRLVGGEPTRRDPLAPTVHPAGRP